MISDGYFLLVGCAAAFIGVSLLHSIIRGRLQRRAVARGQVTKVALDGFKWHGSTVKRYRPHYEFTLDGKTYKAKAPFTVLRESKYQVGQTMAIAYNPKDPRHSAPQCSALREPYGLFGAALTAIGVTFIVCYFL